MSMKNGMTLALILLFAVCGARAQDIFVMSVQGNVVIHKAGRENRALERGYRLPAEGTVDIAAGATLQVMGPAGRLARIEGPCVKQVSALLDAVQKERSRPVSKAFSNLWEKFKSLWKEEGDLDSSGGTRGERPFTSSGYSSDRYRNPPGTEIALVAPRGGYVFSDSVTLVWVNGGAVAPQRIHILTDRLDTAYQAECNRTSVTVPRSRLNRPSGSVYIWSVATPGCNPDEAWFRCADAARSRDIRDQVGQALAYAGGDSVAMHLLRAQIYEEGEFYADACHEFLTAAITDGSPSTRALLENYLTERLGLARKVADELYRQASKGK